MKKRILAFLMLLAILLFAACSTQSVSTENDSNAKNDSEILFVIEGAEKTELTRADFSAIEQYTYTISRTNSKGETTTGDYSGIAWTALADVIGAPSEIQSVTLIASDGYSQAYTLDILTTGKSIFALEKDGKPITEEAENGQVWFCADESYTANNWMKFIEKIVIN